MLNLFPRPPLDNSNSESPKKQSIKFYVKASINIKGEVLMKLMPWLLGGSLFGGGLAYGISNNLLPSNTEAGNNPSHTESVDQSSRSAETRISHKFCGLASARRCAVAVTESLMQSGVEPA